MFRSVSCRVVAASWWLFVLLMVSSYTANLAASFTVGSIDNSINNAEVKTEVGWKKRNFRIIFQGSCLSDKSEVWYKQQILVSTTPGKYLCDRQSKVDKKLCVYILFTDIQR